MNRLFSNLKANTCHIQYPLTKAPNDAIRYHMGKRLFICAPFIALALSACVQVQAPDKPIVINLNIAIRQDVVLRLDKVSEKVIQDNPELF
jgi:DUF1365 family protein